ncbi:helix-turn-helix domain-containing protein [Arthrobacter sp. UM1]|uniref:helix-turn-helix domain-containing protein n=1 Tax=Arthrobacter sp. UM1 TaxID=2766776 RepID=UPI001CF60FC2|nr:helix-turn-helix domain-containing protein [Arthrobacter sp. UM1]MCB4209177.1 helix-turn-helix domain-containing protein [Arthrobacter sp. UM1]
MSVVKIPNFVDSPEVLTTREAARLLGLTVSAVHQVVRRGELSPQLKSPGARGAFFFSRAEVQELAQVRAAALGSRLPKVAAR